MGKSILDYILGFVTDSGAKSEAATDRDGFLSYHAESHAAGMGIAAGFMLVAVGDATLLGLVYGAAVYGKAQANTPKRRRILKDIAQEWHYALGGIVFGAVIGVVVNLSRGMLLPNYIPL